MNCYPSSLRGTLYSQQGSPKEFDRTPSFRPKLHVEFLSKVLPVTLDTGRSPTIWSFIVGQQGRFFDVIIKFMRSTLHMQFELRLQEIELPLFVFSFPGFCDEGAHPHLRSHPKSWIVLWPRLFSQRSFLDRPDSMILEQRWRGSSMLNGFKQYCSWKRLNNWLHVAYYLSKWWNRNGARNWRARRLI